jgi:formylglycine-generating enzyme required for sulfatase activity
VAPPSSPRTPETEHRTPAAPKWQVYTQWPFGPAEAKRRQAETAKALGVPVEQDIDLGNGVKMTMVLIPAGATRVSRGGSWNHYSQTLRSAYRAATGQNERYIDVGFRLVLAPGPK